MKIYTVARGQKKKKINTCYKITERRVQGVKLYKCKKITKKSEKENGRKKNENERKRMKYRQQTVMHNNHQKKQLDTINQKQKQRIYEIIKRKDKRKVQWEE